MSMEHWWKGTDRQNSSTGENPVTVSTIKLTWTDLGPNPVSAVKGQQLTA